VGQAIEEPDGAKTAYVLYSDATEQKRRETEFDKRVRELSVLNPNTIGVFQLDLTRNAIIRIESRAADALGIDPRGTADAFIEKCREIMAGDLGGPEDWAQIRREALISAFQAGKAEIALNFRYIARETDELRWATSAAGPAQGGHPLCKGQGALQSHDPHRYPRLRRGYTLCLFPAHGARRMRALR
jgi:hypothetical protein